MTNTQLRRLVRENDALISTITDALVESSISPEHGEALLLFIAGTSAGARQRSITDPDWARPAAVAWKFAASEEHDDL